MEKIGSDPRAAILDAAARLLRDDGIGAVTTRRVAEAAATQPPTIYRLFGDKDGLLRAVADHVLTTYVETKAHRAQQETVAGNDPLEDLRASYRLHVEFGLANPELFALMIDPAMAFSAAHAAGREVLQARVRRLALDGALRVSEDRAVEMISAAGNGAVLCSLGSVDVDKGLALGDAMFDAVVRSILAAAPEETVVDGVLTGAVSLAAVVPQLPGLTGAERQLMSEWLDRSIEDLQR